MDGFRRTGAMGFRRMGTMDRFRPYECFGHRSDFAMHPSPFGGSHPCIRPTYLRDAALHAAELKIQALTLVGAD